MKKIMVKFLAVCLILSTLPVSAFAADYTVPDYAVTLKASENMIYEGDSVDISFNINSEDFLMTDMSVAYDTTYFTHDSDTSGVVGFNTPEIKDSEKADGDNSYDLATQFTFTAKEVTDTVKVDFDIASADIVYSYESARDDVPTNVENRTSASVIIVKQYDVSFADENGTTLIGEVQKVDKGLDDESDTSLTAPAVNYEDYVADGLVADYYEHVWTYNGNEYTDAEIEAFGQTGSANEITEDTTFVLDVREKTFNVTVPAEDFDTDETPDTATYGTNYTGKINPDEYDDKYNYTVKYEIDTDGDGVADDTKEVECEGDIFTIPGENITGDMTLSFDKELNITLNAYEYFTGHFLITVDGEATGYTFEGHEMFKSENHGNLRAWIFDSGVTPGGDPMTVEEAIAIAEEKIFVSESSDGSPIAPAGYDINESTVIDISDAALAHGAYTGGLQPLESWVKEYLSADVNQSYNVDMDDYDMVVEAYKNK